MAEITETLFVIHGWFMVLLNYIMPIVTIGVLSPDHPIAYLIILYLPINFVYHMANLYKIDSRVNSYDSVFGGDRKCREFQLNLFLCSGIFLSTPRYDRGRENAKKFSKKYETILGVLKFLTSGSTVGWIFLDLTDAQKAIAIIHGVLHTIHAFNNIDFTQMFVCVLLGMIPLLIGVLFGGWYTRKNNQQQFEENQVVSELDNGNQNNINDQEEVKFEQVRRITTNKAMGNIMSDWRRKFTIPRKNKVESCCVCLEEFVKDDQVIELKGGKNHIFHPEGFESRASRSHNGPLCRQDFVDIARNEPVGHAELPNDIEQNESNEIVIRSDATPNNMGNPEDPVMIHI